MNKSDKHGIDILKNLLDGKQKITIDNETIELKKLRELEHKLVPNENKLKNIIIFWDDLVQYTTLGIIDCILQDNKEIIDKTYDFDLFFYRDSEYSYYINFIKKLFKDQFSLNLSDEYIKSISTILYSDILGKSPASSFFHSIIKCEPLYKNILIVFNHYFTGIESFVKSINSRFSGKYNIELKCATLDNFKDEYEFLCKYGKDYDIIAIQNLIKGIEYLEKTKHNGLSFISPFIHNGLSKDYLTAISAVYGNYRSGPYNSELILFDEGISVC